MDFGKSVGVKEGGTAAPGSMARTNWRKKSNVRKCQFADENRHLDVKREANFRMSTLIDRYTKEYGSKKKSSDRETSILKRIQRELGNYFVREVDVPAIQRWFGGLTEGWAVRWYSCQAFQCHAPHDGERPVRFGRRKLALTGIRQIRSK